MAFVRLNTAIATLDNRRYFAGERFWADLERRPADGYFVLRGVDDAGNRMAGAVVRARRAQFDVEQVSEGVW